MKVKHDFKSKRGTWRLSNEQLTVKIEVDNNNIIMAAPVVYKFIGQPLDNLVRWMGKVDITKIK